MYRCIRCNKRVRRYLGEWFLHLVSTSCTCQTAYWDSGER
jgi:hypothetical protein